MLVNFAYKPFLEVLPRKYRFRLLNASMPRFLRLGLVNERNGRVPMTVISTEGNLLVNPVTVTLLDPQGPAEWFDIVVDFSMFQTRSRIRLLNVAEHEDGQGPKEYLNRGEAIRGDTEDPAVGTFLEFRVVREVESVDAPGKVHRASDPDRSRVPSQLTEQVPIITPVRTRHLEWKGADGAADNLNGDCFPDCGDKNREGFGWPVRINGKSNHFLNANRVSMLVPEPGETEHWVLENGGGGWDHPVHLHFEEGVTLNRGGRKLSAIERNARKDTWRLGENGKVRFQVSFGEYGGAFVTHCHNTVHEDWAMLARYDILTDPDDPNQSQTHVSVMLIGNAVTGEWRRTSLMGNLVGAAEEILALDPDWQPPEPTHTVLEGGPIRDFSPESRPGEGLFVKACAACHSIGDGVRVGPDLAGVTLRRERDWLLRYIRTPDHVLAEADAIAVALDDAYPAVRMPNFGPGETDAEDLIRYLHTETERLDGTGFAVEADHDPAAHDHRIEVANGSSGSVTDGP